MGWSYVLILVLSLCTLLKWYYWNSKSIDCQGNERERGRCQQILEMKSRRWRWWTLRKLNAGFHRKGIQGDRAHLCSKAPERLVQGCASSHHRGGWGKGVWESLLNKQNPTVWSQKIPSLSHWQETRGLLHEKLTWAVPNLGLAGRGLYWKQGDEWDFYTLQYGISHSASADSIQVCFFQGRDKFPGKIKWLTRKVYKQVFGNLPTESPGSDQISPWWNRQSAVKLTQSYQTPPRNSYDFKPPVTMYLLTVNNLRIPRHSSKVFIWKTETTINIF